MKRLASSVAALLIIGWSVSGQAFTYTSACSSPQPGCAATKAVLDSAQWSTLYPLVVTQAPTITLPIYSCPAESISSRQDPATWDIFCYDASGNQLMPVLQTPASIYVALNTTQSDTDFVTQNTAYLKATQDLMAFRDGSNQVVFVYAPPTPPNTMGVAPPPLTAAEVAAARATTATTAIATATSSIDATGVQYATRNLAPDTTGVSTDCQSPTFNCAASRIITVPNLTPGNNHVDVLALSNGSQLLVLSDETRFLTHLINPRTGDVRDVCDVQQSSPVGSGTNGAPTMLEFRLRPGTRDDQFLKLNRVIDSHQLITETSTYGLTKDPYVMQEDSFTTNLMKAKKALMLAMKRYDYSQMVMYISNLSGLVDTLFKQPARETCYDVFELVLLAEGDSGFSQRIKYQPIVPFTLDADSGLKLDTTISAAGGVPVDNEWVITYASASDGNLVSVGTVPIKGFSIPGVKPGEMQQPVIHPLPADFPKTLSSDLIWSWAYDAGNNQYDLTMELGGDTPQIAHCMVPTDANGSVTCDYHALQMPDKSQVVDRADFEKKMTDQSAIYESYVGGKVFGPKAKKDVGDQKFGEALSKFMVDNTVKQQLNNQPITKQQILQTDTQNMANPVYVRQPATVSMDNNEDKVAMGQFKGYEGEATSAVFASGSGLQMVTRGSDGSMVLDAQEKLPYDNNGNCVSVDVDDFGGTDLACAVATGVRILPNINVKPIATALNVFSNDGVTFNLESAAKKEKGEKLTYQWKIYEYRNGQKSERPDLTVAAKDEKATVMVSAADQAALAAQKSVGMPPDVTISADIKTKSMGVAEAPAPQDGLVAEVTVADAGGLSDTKTVYLANYTTKSAQGDKANTFSGSFPAAPVMVAPEASHGMDMVGGCSLMR